MDPKQPEPAVVAEEDQPVEAELYALDGASKKAQPVEEELYVLDEADKEAAAPQKPASGHNEQNDPNILPPDSAYGWYIVGASFLAHFAMFGTNWSFGVLQRGGLFI